MHRILIVSDDDFLRNLIRLSLTDMQAEVRCAENTERMEEMCRKVVYDLVILLDVAPFLCGRDVMHTIRPAGLKRPSVYVVSWQHSEQTVMNLLESGVDQYMTFPVNLQRLRSKVANFLTKQ